MSLDLEVTQEKKETKVYVTNFSGFEYEEAEKYGELVYITQGFVNFKDLDAIVKKVNSFVSVAKPDDYLLLSGNNLLCSIAVHRWLSVHRNCKILHYNKAQDHYVEYELRDES